jgi:hypothetical protein
MGIKKESDGYEKVSDGRRVRTSMLCMSESLSTTSSMVGRSAGSVRSRLIRAYHYGRRQASGIGHRASGIGHRARWDRTGAPAFLHESDERLGELGLPRKQVGIRESPALNCQPCADAPVRRAPWKAARSA